MLEAQVHSSLLGFLRTQPQPTWPHHLTLARLVARSLRLGRSAMIQTAALPSTYRLSYLAALLLCSQAVVVVMPQVQQIGFLKHLQQLQTYFSTQKRVQSIRDASSDQQVADIVLATPQHWLSDRLGRQTQFPQGVPTLIDGVDDLETWARAMLTQTIRPSDWASLMEAIPTLTEPVEQICLSLNQSLRDRPINPYGNYRLEPEFHTAIDQLLTQLQSSEEALPSPWPQFCQQWRHNPSLRWATLMTDSPTHQGQLHVAPLDLAPALTSLWQQQPTVLIGRFLGIERQGGEFWRDRLGLGELTTIKFAPQPQQDLIQLYVPERLPFPNSPAFQGRLLTQILRLCRGGMLGQRHGRHRPPEWISPLKRPVVIIVEDTPLRRQVSTALAAEFGSVVQLEVPHLEPESILVSGWDFWQAHQDELPPPQLLIIATLPIPSMENPLVAAQVQQRKQQRQDWFQTYLLPVALQRLQRAVLPVRDRQGVVALLDNRVNHRSYGAHIFQALEPYARINYIDFQSLERV
ncbi:MAG: ATP-dependent DNA helicase [Spirulina sp. SIO3F2]|nr:ATP-dependent DNA helicase [Spirulina sp. SIO3F2]